jgi:FeS assembly SUF system protein
MNKTADSDPKSSDSSSLSPVDQIRCEALKAAVIEVLRTCYDPEVPVDIYELGLIYDVAVQPDGAVLVQMTLTSPMCPVAGSLPGDVAAKIQKMEGVTSTQVDVVWDPPWTPARMSEAAKLQLNIL